MNGEFQCVPHPRPALKKKRSKEILDELAATLADKAVWRYRFDLLDAKKGAL